MPAKNFLIFLLLSLAWPTLVHAQPSPLWKNRQTQALPNNSQQLRAHSLRANYMQVEPSALAQLFSDTSKTVKLSVPLPDGKQVEFSLSPSNVMSPQLAAKFPQLMSYQGVQTKNPNNVGGFTISPKGLTALIFYEGRWVFLSPQYTHNSDQYISYYRDDALPLQDYPGVSMSDDQLLQSPLLQKNMQAKALPSRATGTSIRTYRLAIAASGEYSQAQGGTLTKTMAELVTLVTRVNQILLVDLAIQFQLVGNNDQLVFLDKDTDPYSNSDSEADLEANQTTLDTIIGSGSYDVGHLLNTNGGGLAYVGAICNSRIKAQGYTGDSPPKGERFYIDLVLHELGHQLGANHSFNANGAGSCTDDQRSPQSAFEPGSGSTIMSYAGLCSSQNLQSFSDAYFHAGSIAQIRDHLDFGTGASCGASQPQANTAPQLQATASSYAIPANTPFVLSASGSDAEGDTLEYSWEQIDEGGTSGGTANLTEMGQDNGANPLFKFRPAVSEPVRYFPRLQDVLSNTLSKGETYPSTERTLNFRLTARDGKGGVNGLDIALDVIPNVTGFAVNEPDITSKWIGGTVRTVKWEVSNSQQQPINCQNVDILLDLDGNNNFETSLLSGTENDGQEEVVVPNSPTSKARLMVSCSDNVFYALNPGNFTISLGAESIAPSIVGQKNVVVDEDSAYTVKLDDLEVVDPDNIYPQGFSLSLSTGNNYTLDNQTVIPDDNFNGDLSVGVRVNDGNADSDEYALEISVEPVNDIPLAVDDNGTAEQNSAVNLFDVLANDQDVDNDQLFVEALQYAGNGLVAIEANQISYTPANGFSGSESISYTINDGQGGSANAQLNIVVTVPTPTTPPPSAGNSGGGGSFYWLLGTLAVMFAWRRKNTLIRLGNV
jgi:hypothetical protein